jgi:hypothetical protein
LTYSKCAILLPQYPPTKLPTDITNPISQLIKPLNAKINRETKLMIIKKKFLMGFAFDKSNQQPRINSNNINMAESKTISPAQIPIRKKTMWFLIDMLVLIRLLPFKIFLELVTISINENIMATKSTH